MMNGQQQTASVLSAEVVFYYGHKPSSSQIKAALHLLCIPLQLCALLACCHFCEVFPPVGAFGHSLVTELFPACLPGLISHAQGVMMLQQSQPCFFQRR